MQVNYRGLISVLSFQFQQRREFRTYPAFDLGSKINRHRYHLCKLAVRYNSGKLVVGLAAFEAELVQNLGVDPNSVLQRLNNVVMMTLSSCSVTGRKQSGCCHLQSGIVGNFKSPIERNRFDLTIFEITISYCEKVSNLFGATGVRCKT
jgi:hypothetical protein